MDLYNKTSKQEKQKKNTSILMEISFFPFFFLSVCFIYMIFLSGFGFLLIFFLLCYFDLLSWDRHLGWYCIVLLFLLKFDVFFSDGRSSLSLKRYLLSEDMSCVDMTAKWLSQCLSEFWIWFFWINVSDFVICVMY